jgi:hypothetical protein
MSALDQDANLRILGEAYTEAFILDTSGAQTIYKGVPMVIDQNVDTVNVHGADGLTLADGDVFMGIAAEGKSVGSGDPETTEIECYVWPTILGFKSAVLTNADCGKDVYMSDSATLTASNGAYPRIGKLFKVADGYAFVALDSPYVIDVP